jgi:NADH dehydrogenase
LLSTGVPVKTITRRPNRPNPFGDRVTVAPFNFDKPEELAGSLEGAEVLYNTYWIRFARGRVTFDGAVEDTRTLIRAARDAGVRRIVHFSVISASVDSPLPYFKGKGLVEEAVKGSGLSYAIVRPAVVFGKEDILVNNIAWFLRRFPVFAIFGSGGYRVQPVYAEDVAEIAVAAGRGKDDLEIDAVGPETFTFEEMVRLIADQVRSRAKFVHVRPGLALLATRLMGYVLRDVVLTRDEMRGLMEGLLVSKGEPLGRTRFSEWLEQNSDTVGVSYANELSRHYR